MKSFIFMLIIFLPSFAYTSEYPEITLEKLIDKQEQKKMGLHKLTGQEQEKLRLHIIKMYLRGVDVGIEKGKKKRGNIKPKSSPPRVIESQIDGEFEGWEGETIIKLMNGQIWQQYEYHYHYHYSYMPKVLIYKSGGMYKMKVDGIEKAVGVIQLK